MDRVRSPRGVLRLFLIFLKIGAFTFGGGYAMISIIEREIVEKRKLLKPGDLLDIVAIAESTPGPIAVNAATFVGSRTAGAAGAFAATLGVTLPSFLIMILVCLLFRAFSEFRIVRYAFQGIRAGVLALILHAAVSMFRKCPKSVLAYILMGAAFLLVAFAGLSPIWVTVGCGLIGLAAGLLAGSAGRRAKK